MDALLQSNEAALAAPNDIKRRADTLSRKPAPLFVDMSVTFMVAPGVYCRSSATAATMLVSEANSFIDFRDCLLDQLNRGFLVAAFVWGRFTQRTQRVLKRSERAIHITLFRSGFRCRNGNCACCSRHRSDL
jgi:hypothetical protein